MSLASRLTELGITESEEVEWLHLLVGDWQLIADLSFGDLVLWVPDGERDFRVVAHCRPTTGSTVYPDDKVRTLADEQELRLVAPAFKDRAVVHADELDIGVHPLEGALAYPVMGPRRILGVLTVHTEADRREASSELEQTYRGCGNLLLGMVADGRFPDTSAPSEARRGEPRVGDGMVVLDAPGRVLYASPNAVSLMHRMGHNGELDGRYLAELVTVLVSSLRPVDETLPLVLTGRAPWQTEVESRKVSVSLRAIPLYEGGNRIGALVLARDVSELRRRERELLSRDAMIMEMHHRVKNNLQTVAALLRLQARRTSSPEAKSSLDEAMRRVSIIAVVHDTLSQGVGPDVDFDEIVDKVLRLTPELASPLVEITIVREGGFGHVSSADATSLALALTELVTNAIEHGFPQPEDGNEISGTVWIRPTRNGDRLRVVISDDGAGLPDSAGPGTGLGTQIVKTLVTGDLAGSMNWAPRDGGGTEAIIDVPLRAD